MIVTCERCATQFQLDDSRIPASGVRVRCSRCKHAFEIQLPEPGGATGPGPEDEESDWEFNEDLPGGESDPGGDGIGREVAANVVDDLLGASQSQPPVPSQAPAEPQAPPEPGSGLPPSGLDLAGDTPAVGASLPPLAGQGYAAPPPDAPDDLSLDASPSLLDGPDELETDGDADAPNLDLDLGDADEPVDDPGGDELQSPEDWDLLSGESDSESDGLDFGVSSSRSAAPFDIDPDELIDDRPRWQTWLSKAGNAAGWGLVVALFAFGLYAGLRPAPVSAPPPIAIGPGLEMADVSGRWIDHLEAGPIYVVSGRMLNTRRSTAAAPWLAVELLNDAGLAVVGPARLLSPLRPEALRESSLEEIARGVGDGRRGLSPGEKRRFEAVVGPLPSGVTRLQFVPAEAPPVVETATTPNPPRAGLDPETAPPSAGPDTNAGSPAARRSEPSPPAAAAPPS